MAARRPAALAVVFLLAPFQPAAGEVRFRDEERVRPVGRAEIAAAMRTQRGYDVTATTNAGRFYAGFFAELARRARERDPQGPPLRLAFRDTFAAFLEVTGLAPERAPVFIAAAHRHEQDGAAEKGVPAGRPDLQALARRLARPPAVAYRPLGCS